MWEYSAGFTSEGWFQNEMNIVLPLKFEGLPKSEILERVLNKNLFQLRSETSIKKRFQMVHRRSETFDSDLVRFYIDGSRLDQKALLLYSYLKCYRLPFEFFNEVILYNYRNNKPFVQTIDVEFFIERKESESEKVAGWRPETKKRLRSSILMFFKEGGMLQEEDPDVFRIHPLHLSGKLKSYAIENDPLLCLLSEVR